MERNKLINRIKIGNSVNKEFEENLNMTSTNAGLIAGIVAIALVIFLRGRVSDGFVYDLVLIYWTQMTFSQLQKSKILKNKTQIMWTLLMLVGLIFFLVNTLVYYEVF